MFFLKKCHNISAFKIIFFLCRVCLRLPNFLYSAVFPLLLQERFRGHPRLLLSLRRYMRKLSQEQLHHLWRSNPDFYFDLAPHAMALGIGRAFARRFGKVRLHACPYIQAADTANLTAAQWCQLMRQILDGMNARQRQMPLENMMKVLQNARR